MYEPPVVERVHTEHGSHIEPPYDEGWDDLTGLRWHAAVTEADTGVHVRVEPANYSIERHGRWVKQQGFFCVLVGHSSSGPYTFDQAWKTMNGVSMGVSASRVIAGSKKATDA